MEASGALIYNHNPVEASGALRHDIYHNPVEASGEASGALIYNHTDI